MNEYHLSSRLQKVASIIPENSRLADIGSDHGYLPVYLLLQDKISFAICGEVAKGPYQQTVNEIKKAKVEKKAIVRLEDGLKAIDKHDAVDIITICGMGGKLICDILEKGQDKLTPNTTLLLQPNVNESLVRQWLMTHCYTIIKEDIVEDHHKRYEIIYAKKAEKKQTLMDYELFFGPYLLQEKNQVFCDKWTFVYQTRKKIIAQLKTSGDKHKEKIERFEKENEWIEKWVFSC